LWLVDGHLRRATASSAIAAPLVDEDPVELHQREIVIE
jgi:hypothetical protein